MIPEGIGALVGLTLTSIEHAKGSDVVLFTSTDGRRFRAAHMQDCCERVQVEDVAGDLSDLIGSPIVMAEEATSTEGLPSDTDVAMWTFYKLATTKGYVTIRWLGDSNGYYGVGVDFEEVSS